MKPSKQPAGPAVHWHPDFRVVATLPDTKVIRTSFLVNIVAVVTVLALAYLVFRQESEISSIQSQKDDWSQQAGAKKPRLEKATQLQKEFSEGEKKVQQVQKFVESPVVGSELLLLVAETMPRMTILDVIEMSAEFVRLRGTVVGSSASLSQAYADQLAANPAVKAMAESVRLSSQNRDVAGGRFTFEIEIKLKGGAPAPAPKRPRPAQTKNDDE